MYKNRYMIINVQEYTVIKNIHVYINMYYNCTKYTNIYIYNI